MNDPKKHEQSAGSQTKIVGVITGAPIRSCRRCSAPGTYRPKNPQNCEALARWPDILVEPSDERAGRPVGDTCPCCGEDRKGLHEPTRELARKPGGYFAGRFHSLGEE